jgi:endonuclease G
MTLSKCRIAVGLALSLICATALTPSSASAQPAWPDCSSNYPGDIPPQVTTPNLAGDVKELCYHGFAVTFSGKAPGPLSSSHFLTRQRMSAAEQMDTGTGSQTGTTVHTEMRLPPGQRAQLSDFARSGYTAQQLSSAVNMSDIDSRADSATMANAVPVTAALSQGPWSAVQRSVRNLMAQIDVLYIATGAIYGSGGSATKAGNVAVPSAIFKALYSPEQSWAGAYVCDNNAHPTCRIVTLAALQSAAGIDVFPAVRDAIKQAEPPLPPT